MAFALTSPVFSNGQRIPERHARGGANLSPFLQWEDPPPGTHSFVLVMEDADARGQMLRTIDIPANRRQLAEGRSSNARAEDLPHAFNDFGNLHYDGPEASTGEPTHSYRFRLAAVGVASLGIGPEPDASTVWEAARENLLAEAELVGVYGASE